MFVRSWGTKFSENFVTQEEKRSKILEKQKTVLSYFHISTEFRLQSSNSVSKFDGEPPLLRHT